MVKILDRHGARVAEKFLAPDERGEFLASSDPARFLAKRFAAKEALGKSFGTGIRAPLLMPAISIKHDSAGKPRFELGGAAAELFFSRRIASHLSISDERDYALAFVVLEST